MPTCIACHDSLAPEGSSTTATCCPMIIPSLAFPASRNLARFYSIPIFDNTTVPLSLDPPFRLLSTPNHHNFTPHCSTLPCLALHSKKHQNSSIPKLSSRKPLGAACATCLAGMLPVVRMILRACVSFYNMKRKREPPLVTSHKLHGTSCKLLFRRTFAYLLEGIHHVQTTTHHSSPHKIPAFGSTSFQI